MHVQQQRRGYAYISTFLQSSQTDAFDRSNNKKLSTTNKKVSSLSSTASTSSVVSLHNQNEDTSTIQDYVEKVLYPTDTTSISISSNEASTQEENSTKQINTSTSKFLNACLLVLCFGFAAYTILNVDQGITRGWSVKEQLQRIPLDNWSSYESSLNTQPVATKTTINVIIYLLGDWLSQTAFVKKNLLDFDATRTLRNGLIGMFFGPLVHEYYEFSDRILPVEVGMNRIYKVFMDQTIYLSVKCSIYIVAVNMLNGESWESAVQNVKDKIAEIMFTAWKFWPLVHCVTYGVIPARHRILWVNCVDLIWNAILALKTSGADVEEEQDSVAMDKCVNTTSFSNSSDLDSVAFTEVEIFEKELFVQTNDTAMKNNTVLLDEWIILDTNNATTSISSNFTSLIPDEQEMTIPSVGDELFETIGGASETTTAN